MNQKLIEDYKLLRVNRATIVPSKGTTIIDPPAFMDDKLRGKPEKFEERWTLVGRGLPMNPAKVKK